MNTREIRRRSYAAEARVLAGMLNPEPRSVFLRWAFSDDELEAVRLALEEWIAMSGRRGATPGFGKALALVEAARESDSTNTQAQG